MKTRGWHREDGGWGSRQRLERGDLSPLSAGDSSPSNASAPRDKSPGPESCDESQPSKVWRLVAAVGRRRLTPPWGNAQHSISRALTSAATLLALGIALTAVRAHAQSFAIDWFSVDGGGGSSTGGVYSVSGTIGQPDAGRMSGGNFTLEGGFWGVIAAIQTEGAPTLAVELVGGQVRVSWPAPAPNWVLTETNRLNSAGSPPWPVVSTAQYQTNDGRVFILTAPQPLQNRYFQLRKP